MRASDKEALIHECLVQNYEKYYRMAYSYVFREQDAMDIVQEAAYRAILKSDLLKQPEYADTWICRIVIHEALRFLKKNKQTASVEEVPEQGQEDKYEEVLAEVPRVRKDLGEPPLVTPSSQIVGTQAVFNVLMGERYKVATKETKDILLGKYGQTVKPFNPEVVDKVLGADKDKAITCRPADLLEPELDKIEAEMKQYKQQDEDVLSYALFPQVATEFFKYRQAQQTKVDTTIADTKNGAYPV